MRLYNKRANPFGKHTIDIQVSWHQKKVNADIDVKVGQTYYCRITQNIGNRTAQAIGGIVLGTIVEQTSGKGAYFITPIEESVAKAKIKALLKPIK
jgi:hypothetical protein